jgi:hypothetical protein
MEDNTFKITLKIGGKNKNFTAEPTGRVVYKATEMAVKIGNAPFNTELLDELADFTVELFQNQFTRDELIDGVGVGSLGKVLLGYVQLGDTDGVLNRFLCKGKSLPNVETGTKE